MELLKEGRSVSGDTERVFGSDNECFMGQPKFMKLFSIAQSQNIPLIEFLTLPITVNGEDDRSIHRDKILKTIRRSDC